MNYGEIVGSIVTNFYISQQVPGLLELKHWVLQLKVFF